MKKYILPLALVAAVSSQAQNTYINEQLTNNSSDVIGTARYVGMGGAMGALGADISTISWNPAGIGVLRKNDVSLTFGGLWGQSKIDEESRGAGTFDQMGFVYNISTSDRDVPYVNFAFNYQKKANYNYNFYADNGNLHGLSQMDQFCELANAGFGTDDNMAGYAQDENFFTHYLQNQSEEWFLLNEVKDTKGGTQYIVVDENGKKHTLKQADIKSEYFVNDFRGVENIYTRHSEGGTQGFDFNLSTNIKDCAYLGLTVGFDNVRYRGWTEYMEKSVNYNGEDGSYGISNDVKINGYGFNFKLGTIFRPIEDSPFRIGFAVETPTWYRMKNSTLYGLSNDFRDNGALYYENIYESYLEYTMRSPWKVRASLGSTVGSSFAWDVDYEYAGYQGMKMGYPKWGEHDQYHNSYSNDTDPAMNTFTKETLKGVHTVRAGVEYRPAKAWALRAGYNFISPAHKKNASFDQYTIDSPSRNYLTSTEYMLPGATNILTLGVGYRYKAFYVDLAYKVRNQKADFYAFDTNFTNADSDFSAENPLLSGAKLDPVEVNLTRQAITCTLGFKF